jgi:transcriptional regulator with XRE-family HTH domain
VKATRGKQTLDDDLRALIQQRRRDSGLTLQQIADESGVSLSSLYRFLYATSRRLDSKQSRLARWLGLELRSRGRSS